MILAWQHRELFTKVNHGFSDLPQMACLIVHNMFGHDLISAAQLRYPSMG